MFKHKKKIIETPNPTIIHFKELWNEVVASSKSIHKAMLTVIAREKIITLYPNGADKDIAIARLNDARIKFRNTLAAYDDAKRKMMQYYVINQFDIDFELPSWNPFEWEESADVVERFYRSDNNLWMHE